MSIYGYSQAGWKVAPKGGSTGYGAGGGSAQTIISSTSPTLIPDYNAIIYASGSTYYAADFRGNTLSVSSDFFVVCTAALLYCSTHAGGVIRVAAGAYNITSDTVNVNVANVKITGKGATITRSVNYTGSSKAIFNITASYVEIEDLTLTDSVQVTATKIIISQPSSDIENITIKNVTLNTPGYQAIVISATTANTISGIMIDGVIVNETKNSGAGIVIGKGAGSATIQNCRLIECGHSPIDVWGCNQYVKVLNNYIDKTTNTNGIGIAVTNYRDSDTEVGTCKEINISGNRFRGVVQYDAIMIHGEAQKVIVEKNFIVDAAGRHGINITFHDLTTDRYAREVWVRGNVIRGVGGSGVGIVSSSAITFQAFEVCNNFIQEVDGDGINLTSNVYYANVHHNMIWNPGQAQAADASGIRVRISAYNTVHDNVIVGDADMIYSLYEDTITAGEYNFFINNVISGGSLSILDRSFLIEPNYLDVRSDRLQYNKIAIPTKSSTTILTNKTMDTRKTHTELADLGGRTSLTSQYAFAGNVNDSVGGINLTAIGAPTYSSAGQFGQAIVLNGTTQYAEGAIAGNHDMTTGDFSITGWIYRTTDSGTREQLVSKRGSNSTDPGYRVTIDSNDFIVADISDGDAATAATGTTAIALNTWYHFVASYDRDANLNLYVNGILEKANSITAHQATLTNALKFTIGAPPGGADQWFAGRIDDVRVYSIALSAAQALQVYSEVAPGAIYGCVSTGGAYTAGEYYVSNLENTATRTVTIV